MHNNFKAIVWMLIHVITAALMSMYYRVLGEQLLEEVEISFLMNLCGLILIIPVIAFNYINYNVNYNVNNNINNGINNSINDGINKGVNKFVSAFWKLHFLRSFCTVSSNLLLIYAYNNMPFAQVSAITLTYPLFSTLGAAIFLGEKIGSSMAIAITIGFIGSLIIINPSYNEFNSYSIFALLAMCLWVVFDILTRKFKNNESIIIQSFYTLIFTTIISAIPLSLVNLNNLNNFLNFPIDLISKIPYLGLIVLLYVISGFVAIIFTEVIALVMPFYFLVLVISSAIGYYVFNENLSLSTVLGALIILSSTTYIAYREYKLQRVQMMQSQAHLI